MGTRFRDTCPRCHEKNRIQNLHVTMRKDSKLVVVECEYCGFEILAWVIDTRDRSTGKRL